MSAEIAAFDDSVRPESPAFQPSAGLRSLLLLGVVAALAIGALSIGSILADAQVQGWEVGTLLDLVSIVPLLLVTWCYLRLAKELGSIGLRRGSLGTLCPLMLLPILALCEPNLVGDIAAIVITVTVAALTVSLLVALSYRPTWASSAVSVGDPAKAKAGWGGLGGLGIFLFIAVKVLARGGIGWIGKQVGDDWLGVLLAGILGVLLLMFLLVSGIVKLRLGRRLGLTSTLLGIVEIGLPILLLVVIAWFLAELAVVMENPPPNDPDGQAAMEDLMLVWKQKLLPVGVCVHAAWTIMTVLFFWSVRGSADPELAPLE